MALTTSKPRTSALLLAAVVISSKLSVIQLFAEKPTPIGRPSTQLADNTNDNFDTLANQRRTLVSTPSRTEDRSQTEGPAAAQLVPVLRESLTSDDTVLVLAATRAIGHLGPVAWSAEPELVALLDSSNEETRVAAIVALGQIGSSETDAVEEKLVAAANDASPAVRQAALGVLAEASVPRRYDAFLTALAGQDEVSKSIAIQGLRTKCPVCVAALTEALTQKTVCCDAAGLLSDLGPYAAPAIPELVQHLKMEARESGQVESLIALASIGPASVVAEVEILNALESQSSAVTAAAAYATGAIGIQSATDSLREIVLGDQPATVRLSAAKSLAQLSRSPKDQKLAVDLTTTLLRSKNPVVQEVAVQTAVELSSITPRIVQALYANARAADSIETDALIEIGPASILAIDHRLKVERTRDAALAVVTALGPAARVATPTLLHLLDDVDGKTRPNVIRALSAVGVNNQGLPDTVVVQRLLVYVSGPTAVERTTAALAIASLSPEIANSIPAVREAIENEFALDRTEQKLESARVLSRIAPGKSTATLLENLLDEDAVVSDIAATALAGTRE